MATRENTGLQASLIITAIFAVGMAVVASVFYLNYSTASKEREDFKKKRDDMEANLEKANFHVQALTTMISGDPTTLKDIPIADAGVQAIADNFQKHMGAFAATEPNESERNYSQIGSKLVNELQNKNKQNSDLTKSEQSLSNKNQQLETSSAQQVAQAEAAQKKASDEVLAQRTAFETYKKKDASDRETLRGQIATANSRVADVETKLGAQNEELTKKVAAQDQVIKFNTEKISRLEGDAKFRIPDGRITYVNQRGRVVWINVGIGDGLRRQTTFSVYDFDINGIDGSAKKGSLEVTKVVDEHLAEARITDDLAANPIMPGDVIYSPVWRPGRRMSFALAGIMDINGNGKRDENEREIARQMILANGALVPVQVKPNGEITGSLSAAITYVVQGIAPQDNPAEFKGYTDLLQQATDSGIQKIRLDQFLSLMGYQGEIRTVNLSKGARGEDFEPKLKSGLRPRSSGQTSKIFRKRQPPSGRTPRRPPN